MSVDNFGPYRWADTTRPDPHPVGRAVAALVTAVVLVALALAVGGCRASDDLDSKLPSLATLAAGAILTYYGGYKARFTADFFGGIAILGIGLTLFAYGVDGFLAWSVRP